MSQTDAFSKGDRILCISGKMIYPAIVQNHRTNNGQVEYLVHYVGWKKSYDEWIPSTRTLEHNKANLKRQLECSNTASKVAKPKAKKLKMESPIIPEQPTIPKLEPALPANDDEPIINPAVAARIKIPDGLKSWIMYDWTAINRQHRLHIIPAKTTVQDILAAYTIYRGHLDISLLETATTAPATISSDTTAAEVQAVTDSLIEYFDTMLGTQLLYKHDRAQYTEVLGQHPPDTPMSRVYGSFHLLRLFMRLDELLVHSHLEPEALGRVTAQMQELLQYLDVNSDTYFSRQQFVDLPGPESI